MEPLAAEDDCEHLTFNVGVSLFAITKGLAGKRDGLPVLNENGAESSVGGATWMTLSAYWSKYARVTSRQTRDFVASNAAL